MSEKMQTELIQLINELRGLNQDRPFLSNYENGVREGTNNTVDGFVEILSKYFPVVVNEIESLSKEPKMVWGQIVFNDSEKNYAQEVQFFEELLKFDTKDNIKERKQDTERWNKFQNSRYYYGYQALFSMKEANHLYIHSNGAFALLESDINEEGVHNEIDKEWLVAYISEEKSIYNKVPSASQISMSWEQNKGYFPQNKEKPFGVVNVNNE